MITADNIEKEVDRLLMKILENKPLMKLTVKSLNKGAYKIKNEIRENLRKAKAEKDKVSKKRDKAINELLDKVDYEDGVKMLNLLGKEEKEINERIEKMEIEFEESGLVIDEDKAWEILAEKLPEILEADLNKKKMLTRIMFDSIHFTPEGKPSQKRLSSVVLAFDADDVENIFFDEKCVPPSTSMKHSCRTDTVKIEISPVIFYKKSRKSSRINKGGL